MSQAQVLVSLLLVICYVWTSKADLFGGDLLGGIVIPDPTTEVPTVRTFATPGVGQVQSPFCSKTPYGCCKDFTVAPSNGQIGCAKRLCYDIDMDCPFKKRYNLLECHKKYYANYCPFSCGLCRVQASPFSSCLRFRPGYGCCWNGVPATGPHGRGCLPCMDTFAHACKQFAPEAHGRDRCKTASYYLRTFLSQFCPRTCGRCVNDFHYWG